MEQRRCRARVLLAVVDHVLLKWAEIGEVQPKLLDHGGVAQATALSVGDVKRE
jgi:hypothetical protein